MYQSTKDVIKANQLVPSRVTFRPEEVRERRVAEVGMVFLARHRRQRIGGGGRVRRHEVRWVSESQPVVAEEGPIGACGRMVSTWGSIDLGVRLDQRAFVTSANAWVTGQRPNWLPAGAPVVVAVPLKRVATV